MAGFFYAKKPKPTQNSYLGKKHVRVTVRVTIRVTKSSKIITQKQVEITQK